MYFRVLLTIINTIVLEPLGEFGGLVGVALATNGCGGLGRCIFKDVLISGRYWCHEKLQSCKQYIAKGLGRW
jgi:hypothetical protein